MALRPHVAVGLPLSEIDPTPILKNHSLRLDRNQMGGGQIPCRQRMGEKTKDCGAAEGPDGNRASSPRAEFILRKEARGGNEGVSFRLRPSASEGNPRPPRWRSGSEKRHCCS